MTNQGSIVNIYIYIYIDVSVVHGSKKTEGWVHNLSTVGKYVSYILKLAVLLCKVKMKWKSLKWQKEGFRLETGFIKQGVVLIWNQDRISFPRIPCGLGQASMCIWRTQFGLGPGPPDSISFHLKSCQISVAVKSKEHKFNGFASFGTNERKS